MVPGSVFPVQLWVSLKNKMSPPKFFPSVSARAAESQEVGDHCLRRGSTGSQAPVQAHLSSNTCTGTLCMSPKGLYVFFRAQGLPSRQEAHCQPPICPDPGVFPQTVASTWPGRRQPAANLAFLLWESSEQGSGEGVGVH